MTPIYVTGFTAERELTDICRIALGSLRNKIVLLLPGVLLLSELCPGLITPLPMLGGACLCVEWAEKITDVVRLDGPARGGRGRLLPTGRGHDGCRGGPHRPDPVGRKSW